MTEQDIKRIEEAALRNCPVTGEEYYKAGATYEHNYLTTQVVEAERKYSELKVVVIQYGEALKGVMSQIVENGKADALSMVQLSEMTLLVIPFLTVDD